MKMTFLGAANEVTGSMHLVESPQGRLLIDCGMFQGHRRQAEKKNRTFQTAPDTVDAVVLSHAHIDHSGRLPLLHARGFNGNIYATSATRDLCSIMLRDSAHIQQMDAEYINRKRAKNGEEPVDPLYSQLDGTKVLRHIVSVGYGRRFSPVPGVSGRLVDAGHILGAALIRLDFNGVSPPLRFGYAVDLGRPGMPILRDPESLADDGPLDVLVLESTYGGRHHDPPEDMEAELGGLVNRVVERGGKLVIPAFSVGRTQNVLYSLHKLFIEERIPSVPVFVDSPLSVNATDVFKMHPECYDDEAASFVEDGGSVFTHRSMHYVSSLAESKTLQRRRRPAIIISASGMCEAGRILHHLKNTITNERNAVGIVGYMAEHTLGRRLVERHEQIKIFGKMYPVRCEIATMNGFSAHADHDGLLDYADSVAGPDTRIFLVHGEEKATAPLLAALRERGHTNTTVTSSGMTVDL